MRPAVEKTRPNTTKNPDVDRLEEDVNRITKRWGNCCMQASTKAPFLIAKKELGGSKELMASFSFVSREKTLPVLEGGNGTHLPGLGFSGF